MALTPSEIDRLVEHFPLPSNVTDVQLNRAELASFFGVTANTISSWMTAGMPILNEGKQGEAYAFQASACWAWKRSRDYAEAARSEEAQAALAAMRLNLVGGKTGDTIAALPAREQRELFAIRAEHERLKREINQSLDRDEVKAAMDDLMRMVRDGVSSLPDTLERSAKLDATGVQSAIEACDELLEIMARTIGEFFESRPVRHMRQGLFE